MVRSLDPEVRKAVARHGMRNALVTSIAPTGTISLFADNVSSGIEPVFAYSYTRNVLLPDGRRAPEQVVDYAFRRHQDMFGPDAPLPESFVDAQGLRPEDHVRIQAAAQEHVDSSISKDRKSTRLNSSHYCAPRMTSSACNKNKYINI